MARISFLSAAILMAVPVFFGIATNMPLQPLISTDESALFEFKNRITSDPYRILAKNWTSTTHPCSWTGVTCSLLEGKVVITSLNISGFSLGGIISPVLGNLTFLTSLDISHNNFTGFVPTELGNLHGLKQMNLGYNNLSGDIPASFITLSQLQLLNLRDNSFTGMVSNSLFANMSELESLDLSHNFLQGSIPYWITNLTNLRLLSLGYNQFTGSIPPGIFSMPFLEIIYLPYNSLSGSLPRGMCSSSHQSKLKDIHLSFNRLQQGIPIEIYKCRDIEGLLLEYNEFDGTIPRTIGHLMNLKRLYISGNNLGGRIPPELGNLTRLEELNISSCSLTGRIPVSIFNLSSLRWINLSNNSFSGSIPSDMLYNLPGLQLIDLSDNALNGYVPSFIWDCKTLVVLRLSNNNFTGSISKGIGNLTLLQHLRLDNNKLTGELPAEFGNLANLELVDLDTNNLSGVISPEIFNMSSLAVLILASNHLAGSLPSNMWVTLPELQWINLSDNYLTGILPSFISNASKITQLIMLENFFTGPIPATIGNLRFLTRLFLGGNNLTREPSTPELRFISSLTNCRQLELVEISHNQFHGFLPKSLGNFSTSLQVFNAFDAMILGTIPREIGNLSSLEAINLDNNDFNGSIPSTIGKLSRVDRIYLEHNRLEGNIPVEICNLTNLGDLYLDDNRLSGLIPECLGELKSLRAIYLQSNNLSSTIPTSLWGLQDLLGMNLSSNQLSGPLPSEIGKWKVITQLDLSRNQLSGTIPTALGSVEALVHLSLGQNKFEGEIPESLGNLLSLEYLDLSHNDLSGTIPKSLEKLKHMIYFNVSFNRLEGEVPSGGPFVNFTIQSFLHNYAFCGSYRLHFPPCNPKSESNSRSRKVLHALKYILPVIAILSILLLIAILWREKRSKIEEQTIAEIETPFNLLEWKRVSYHDLLRATNSFGKNNLIGAGSFGSVYKAKFPDGSIFAIKVFNLQSDDEGSISKSFAAECQVLASIRHRNLIKIISCVSVSNPPPHELEFKALVLEYMPNGSLENWLYPTDDRLLDMIQRLNIMVDVASALEYLHNYHTHCVVHCDLKPSNILLDERMGAHLCDFGIAKLLGEGEIMAQTRTLATFGYMAPEFGMEGMVSTSGDVYSYGVILLETFTGKKPTDDIFGANSLNLKQWVKDSIQGNSVMGILDSSLIRKRDDYEASYTEAEEKCLISIFQVGLDCLVDSPQDRINMRDVLTRLKMIKLSLNQSTHQTGIVNYSSDEEEV